MRVSDYSFRELDKRWVGIENKKFCKKIGKKLGLKNLARPVFGCFYIDKEYGLSLRIVGNIERDGRNKLYLDEELLFDNDLVLDYDFISKFEIELLDEDIVKVIEGSYVLENKLDIHYKNVNNFLETRKWMDLDNFRNEQFPDDIQVLLVNKGDNPDELLWARVEGIMDVKPDVLICKLLGASYYNDEYVEDVMVGVKYFKDDDNLKIVGLLKKREK
jgi:hypothetical protein